MKRVVRALLNPGRALLGIWRRVPFGSFDLRCDFDLFDRPHYAYGVQQASTLAARLGIPAISVIEFGVAGGRGLVALERVAALASKSTGVEIKVFGFDRGVGLPPATDYRDVPYTWRGGDFRMDVPALQAKLQRAELVLGDIAETIPAFVARGDVPPVGFAAIDVDLYSSTVDALRLFDAPDDQLLPRALLYFDDLVGEDHVLQNEFVGELRAISEYNEAHADRKIAPINGLQAKRTIPADWCGSMFAFHAFAHPRYNDYVGPDVEPQLLPL